MLKDDVGSYTERPLQRLVEQKDGMELLELNVQANHTRVAGHFVHMVMVIPPKYAVSEVMGYLKGKTAIRLFQRYKQLGKQYWGRHLWSRGYYVSKVPGGAGAVGLDEEKIRKYVLWQEQKDKEAEQQGLFR